jgi:hypothetical protein
MGVVEGEADRFLPGQPGEPAERLAAEQQLQRAEVPLEDADVDIGLGAGEFEQEVAQALVALVAVELDPGIEVPADDQDATLGPLASSGG